jgi:hypothetical protein
MKIVLVPVLGLCYESCMGPSPTAAVLSSLPDPPTDRPDTSVPASSRAGRLMGFLRKVVGYGKEIAASLRQRVSPCPCAYHLVTVMRNFGTVDIGLILASITRALLRAEALEARLVSRGDQPDDAPARTRATPARLPRPARPPAQQHDTDAEPAVLRMPTPEAIAAQIRRRPVGAVLADICFDLGIGTNHPLWPELRTVINENGGNATALMLRIFKRERKAMEHGRTGVWADKPVPLFPDQPITAPSAWTVPLAAASGADPP